MKKILTKSLVLAVAIFLSVLFIAPAMIHADPAVLVSITVTPEYGEIPVLGQSTSFKAWANYSDGTSVEKTGDAGTIWAINNPSIASNDGGGAFKAIAEGNTWVSATFGGAVGWANLNVWRPGMGVDVGLPGETTGFNLWASGCNGLTWALDVAGPTTYSASGAIGSDEWSSFSNSVLSTGNYIATYSVGGAVQDIKNFTVWDHTASMDVSPGYSGEVTNITLKATNSNGAVVNYELYKQINETDWERLAYDETTKINTNDPWSLAYTFTLEKGNYWAAFSLDGRWEDGKDFSVVDRGVPQPVSQPRPLTSEEQASLDLSIKQQADLYGATNIGFTKMLYDNILGRAADDEGLNNWVAALNEGKITLNSVVYNFVFSKELESIISPSSPTEFVTFLYKNVLGRNPDPQGLASWVDNMKNGMSKEEVLLHFLDSDEFKNIYTMFGLKS